MRKSPKIKQATDFDDLRHNRRYARRKAKSKTIRGISTTISGNKRRDRLESRQECRWMEG